MLTLATIVSLMLGQAQGLEPFYTNKTSNVVPLLFEKTERNKIRQLMLFSSSDQGKTWMQEQVVPPTKEDVVFAARTDGEYWLQIVAIDHQGKQAPENILESPPQQKIIVDTVQPLVRITSAQRVGDEIQVGWEIQEKNPDWNTFRIDYRLGSTSVWIPVAIVNAQAQGQTHFRPNTLGTVDIRVYFRDKAENAALASFQLKGTEPDLPATGVQVAQASGVPSGLVPPPQPMFPSAVPPPQYSKYGSPPPVMPPPGLDTLKGPQKIFPPPPQKKNTQGAPAWETDGQVAVASSENAPLPTPSKAPTPPPAVRRSLPPLQYVNQPEVVIEYELTRVGPSGVGKVDLWWTQDEGLTWEKYAYDEEVKAAGKHQRVVELPGDGIYGFAIVVKSRAGLGRKEPKPGDVPEIRVQVDTIAPVAHLFAPMADKQRGNTLILSWNARDNNLHSHPINLEWAEQREGPWNPIAANLANTGKHPWQLPPNIPVQVYLRLRVHDCAGNESVAVTPEPLLVDLTEPEGHLLNVTIPRRP